MGTFSKVVGQGRCGEVAAAVFRMMQNGDEKYVTAYGVAKVAKVSHVTARKYLQKMVDDGYLIQDYMPHRKNTLKVTYCLFPYKDPLKEIFYRYDLMYQKVGF